MPQVKPLKSDSGPTVRQPKAPFRALSANALFVGPSGSGKSLTLLRTLMDSDKLGGMFDRYEIFSPNIWIDPQYKALIRYIEQKTNQKQDDFCHEDFDQSKIQKLMEEQKNQMHGCGSKGPRDYCRRVSSLMTSGNGQTSWKLMGALWIVFFPGGATYR